MTDINLTLHRLAHGSAEHRMRLFNHHDRAAHHHEKAAEQHRLAAEAHRSGDTTIAAGHATQALGHGAHAQDHANESLKSYAPSEADTEAGAVSVPPAPKTSGATQDEPPASS